MIKQFTTYRQHTQIHSALVIDFTKKEAVYGTTIQHPARIPFDIAMKMLNAPNSQWKEVVA